MIKEQSRKEVSFHAPQSRLNANRRTYPKNDKSIFLLQINEKNIN